MKMKTITKSKITPEDVIVVYSNDALGLHKIDFLKRQFEDAFGTRKIVVLDEGMTFDIIKMTTVFQEQVEEAIQHGDKR